jgi:hypothetical protein
MLVASSSRVLVSFNRPLFGSRVCGIYERSIVE